MEDDKQNKLRKPRLNNNAQVQRRERQQRRKKNQRCRVNWEHWRRFTSLDCSIALARRVSKQQYEQRGIDVWIKQITELKDDRTLKGKLLVHCRYGPLYSETCIGRQSHLSLSPISQRDSTSRPNHKYYGQVFPQQSPAQGKTSHDDISLENPVFFTRETSSQSKGNVSDWTKAWKRKKLELFAATVKWRCRKKRWKVRRKGASKTPVPDDVGMTRDSFSAASVDFLRGATAGVKSKSAQLAKSLDSQTHDDSYNSSISST